MHLPRLALTPGEPAGLGPDLAVAIAGQSWPAEIVVFADPDLLARRARRLGYTVSLEEFDPAQPVEPHRPGVLKVVPVGLQAPVVPGRLDPANAPYVLATLEQAVAACRTGRASALVTGPVHKGIINDAGVAFTGHTEFLQARTGAQQVVMMLATEGLRVALATTHLPLARVPEAITPARLESVIRVLETGLREYFGLPRPRITVLGLNPHAGEGGHLGREELVTIQPVLDRLRAGGMHLDGPLPADTAFTPAHLEQADAVLAMYHDQGLPVLKHLGFGRAVNITLGLPIIRTSVDHGTALDLAGTGRGDCGSLVAAIGTACEMVRHRRV